MWNSRSQWILYPKRAMAQWDNRNQLHHRLRCTSSLKTTSKRPPTTTRLRATGASHSLKTTSNKVPSFKLPTQLALVVPAPATTNNTFSNILPEVVAVATLTPMANSTRPSNTESPVSQHLHLTCRMPIMKMRGRRAVPLEVSARNLCRSRRMVWPVRSSWIIKQLSRLVISSIWFRISTWHLWLVDKQIRLWRQLRDLCWSHNLKFTSQLRLVPELKLRRWQIYLHPELS